MIGNSSATPMAAEWQDLYRVGPGTLAGRYLRRWWHPVARAQDLHAGRALPIRSFGEDFTLYRGEAGRAHALAFRCAHRGTQLSTGWVEGDNLRCFYHGWAYGPDGQCVEQPAEPEESTFKDRIRLRAYPTQEFSGLIYAYLGPEPAPLLPLYDVLRMEAGVKTVQVQTVHANWLNHVENIVDISHLAWLHGYTFPAYGGRKVTYRWERTEYGANNVMLVDGIDDTHISCYGFPLVNRFALPPVEPGGELVRSMIYRAPVDDTSTLLYFVRFYPSDQPAFRTQVRASEFGVYTPLESDWWGIDVNDQDRMVVEQQGCITDRGRERLGASDGGIILMRQMMREALAAVAAGVDPPAIIRDPARQQVDFPQKSDHMYQRQADVSYAVR